jgi:hypothetical protein
MLKMTKLRVPKTFYHYGSVITFYVKTKEIFYNLNKWNESGTNLALLSTGKYNNEDPKDLITLEIKSEQK